MWIVNPLIRGLPHWNFSNKKTEYEMWESQLRPPTPGVALHCGCSVAALPKCKQEFREFCFWNSLALVVDLKYLNLSKKCLGFITRQLKTACSKFFAMSTSEMQIKGTKMGWHRSIGPPVVATWNAFEYSVRRGKIATFSAYISRLQNGYFSAYFYTNYKRKIQFIERYVNFEVCK